ncbi:MAG: sulfotransferase [Trueperaceae bacterium]|nr:MAG: sulfotransferase [Trueperaceae bacterium]
MSGDVDAQRLELLDAVQAGVASGNTWLFSLNKSGTTFLCHVLAFYYARLLSRSDITFDTIRSVGILRWSRDMDVETYIASAIAFRSSTSLPLVVVTPHNIRASYRTAVLLTRNPFDYCVSSYHYRYVRRRHQNQVSLDEAIPDIIAKWVATEIDQTRLLEADPEHVKRVRYEDLVTEPEREIAGILRFMGVEGSEADLRIAIAEAGKDRLREHEIQTGRAAVAGDSFTAPHFVRSGKIGEWRGVLSPAQVRVIEDQLERCGIPSSRYDQDA